MEREPAMRTHAFVDLASAPGASRFHRWIGGGIALLLLIMCWGAWVLLIGFRPCALSYLLWR
jgi:hypothetical protein